MAEIELYRRGFVLRHPRNLQQERRGGGKRGKLEGKVSSASFRRLRKWCVTHDLNVTAWGITLTVPGVLLISDEEFRCLHHKLCVWLNYHKVPAVWRVELQQRGQPHLHLVVYADVRTSIYILLTWYKLLDRLPWVLNLEPISKDSAQICYISRAFLHGSEHAVDLQKLSGDFRSWRYLVTHMSKGKLLQTGWRGRNWGVVNKDMFCELPGIKADLQDVYFYKVRRWLNRLYSGVPSKNKGKRVNKHLEKFLCRGVERRFSRHLGRSGTVYCVSNPLTVQRMLEFVRSLEVLPF